MRSLFPVLALMAMSCGEPDPEDDTGPEGDADTDSDSDADADADADADTDTDADADAPLVYGDLVVTEVMTSGGYSNADRWFEITNTRSHPVDIDGLEVWHSGGPSTLAGPGLLDPGEHAVIMVQELGDKTDYPWLYQAEDIELESDGFLELFAEGRQLDRVEWNAELIHLDDTSGWALSLDEALTDADENDDIAHWCYATAPYGSASSTDDETLGTPGEPNGTCVGTFDDWDGDGYVQDTYGGDDCNDLSASVHPNAAEACGADTDDDCDGLIGCDDSDCWGSGVCEDCSDGVDDDGDGLMDCEDGDCALHEACTELICDDGLDSDDDGLIDCADDDCWGGACHPGGVRSWVTHGGAFERTFLIVESERGFSRVGSSWFEATGIQGRVQVLPPGITSWGASSASATCSWSLAFVSERFHSRRLYDPDGSYCSSHYTLSPAVRSGLNVTPGCRLYSTWFLPEKLLAAYGGGDVWADYWFTPCSLSGVDTLWYPLVSSSGWSTHIRSTTTRGSASTVFQEYWAGTTHAVIGSGGSSFLQVP